MSKEYYKKRIIDLRASIAKEIEAKKKDTEYYTRSIKNASLHHLKQAIVKARLIVPHITIEILNLTNVR